MTAGGVSAPLIIASSLHRSRRDIDTHTPVLIQSDTPGTLIFYTLDGSRPEPVQSRSAAGGRKYSHPIRLPVGRVAVRAVAVASDGRESSVVTKMFVVHNQGSSRKNIGQINRQDPCEEPSCSVGSSGPWMGGDDPSPSGPHFKSPALLTPLSGTEASTLVQDSGLLQGGQVNRDSDVLRCLGPGDPLSRFCPCCGANLQKLPPPVAGQQEHRVCTSCGSRNPVTVSSCLTCESRLQPAVCVRAAPSADRKCCCTCWDSKPRSASGLFLRGSTPPTTRAVATAPPAEDTHCTMATPSADSAWRLAPPTAEKSTQTVGLYYPSATQMQKERERALQLSRQAAREPPLTSISPGKGYWRTQLDHVCAHLRSYTQNNAPFRALLGDPSLGQLVSAVVQEDLHQLTLTMSFALAQRTKKQGAAGGGVDPSEPPAGGSSLRSGPVTAGSRQMQVKDAQLMMELGPGRGHISVVQQLLDQGADPACCHSNGRHALAVAVLNGHHELLPVLVQRGADIDQQSGPVKNSALHEAAALGPEGLQCAAVLLSCGANVRRKNASGQTPFDLAAASGCSSVASLLAAHTGRVLLDRLVKPKDPTTPPS